MLDGNDLQRRDILSTVLREEYLATTVDRLPELRAAWRDRIEITVERAYRAEEDREAPEFLAMLGAAECAYRWLIAVQDLMRLGGRPEMGEQTTLSEAIDALDEHGDPVGRDPSAELRAALRLMALGEATYRVLNEEMGGAAV